MSLNTTEQWKQEKHPLDVVEDLREYAEEELDFEAIEERAGDGEWERLKWAGTYTQKQEGYFMMRTKVPGGHLTPEQAEVIGEVAEEYAVQPEEEYEEVNDDYWGDAYLDITTRQDIQMHWIRVEDVTEIWDKYDEVGLTTIQAAVTPRATFWAVPRRVSTTTSASTPSPSSTPSPTTSPGTASSGTSRGSSR